MSIVNKEMFIKVKVTEMNEKEYLDVHTREATPKRFSGEGGAPLEGFKVELMGLRTWINKDQLDKLIEKPKVTVAKELKDAFKKEDSRRSKKEESKPKAKSKKEEKKD
jgi:hypothetical protein